MAYEFGSVDYATEEFLHMLKKNSRFSVSLAECGTCVLHVSEDEGEAKPTTVKQMH